jgi:hypothetical protein
MAVVVVVAVVSAAAAVARCVEMAEAKEAEATASVGLAVAVAPAAASADAVAREPEPRSAAVAEPEAAVHSATHGPRRGRPLDPCARSSTRRRLQSSGGRRQYHCAAASAGTTSRTAGPPRSRSRRRIQRQARRDWTCSASRMAAASSHSLQRSQWSRRPQVRLPPPQPDAAAGERTTLSLNRVFANNCLCKCIAPRTCPRRLSVRGRDGPTSTTGDAEK